MPFFSRKKKKKPEPPPRANSTRLSAENVYVTLPTSHTQGTTVSVDVNSGTGRSQSVYSNSSTEGSASNTSSNVPTAGVQRRTSSKKKAAPPPPPRTSSAKSSNENLSSADVNSVLQTLINGRSVVNGHYQGAGEDDRDNVFCGWQVTPPEEWNDHDVMEWLQSVGLYYFVDIFEGCGIDGDYLMQVTEQDLIELDIEDVDMRASLIRRVEELKRRPKSPSMLKLQQHSIKRHNLEDELNTRVTGELEKLLKLQEDQESRIDADIARLKEEQKLADELISNNQKTMQENKSEVRPSLMDTSSQSNSLERRHGSIISPPDTFISDDPLQYFGKPVDEWTEEEVLIWLDCVLLSRHKDSFQAMNITGKHLAEIDPQLLGNMNITSAKEREVVLSKIYELLNPSANHDEDQLLNDANKATGYEREKYMAAVTALKSDVHVQLPPQDSSTNITENKVIGRNENVDHKKKSSSGLSKLKGVISSKKKDTNIIQMWSDLSQQGKHRCDTFQATDSLTSEELIQTYLENHNMVEDHRLYRIAEVPLEIDDSDESVPERELRANENPLKIQHNWPDMSSFRFELKKKHGSQIKVMDRITGHKAKGKLMTISQSTPCYKVLQLALHKFDMKHVDTSLFCLLELDDDGDIRLVQDMEIPAQLPSNRFILCDKANMENQMAITENIDEYDHGIVRRHSSSNSLNSSGMASIEYELSQDSEESNQAAATQKSSRDAQKEELQLKVVELEMQLLKLEDNLKTGANQLSSVKKENQKQKAKEKKFMVLQKTVSKLLDSYKKEQSVIKKKLTDQSRKREDVLPLAIADLKASLERTTLDIQTKEKQIQKLKQEQQDVNEQGMRNIDVIELLELEYKVALSECSLLHLQHKHVTQYAEFELAKTEHLLLQEKKKQETRAKQKQHSVSMQSVLPLQEPCFIIAMEIIPGHHGYDFVISSSDYEEDGVYVTSCELTSQLREGDRIVEVNGVNVCEATDAEVNTMLNSKMSSIIVVLRLEQKHPIRDDELKSVKDDLSLVREELLNEKQKRCALETNVTRLKSLETTARRAEFAEKKVHHLSVVLSDSQYRCEELENKVDEFEKTKSVVTDTEKTLDHLQQQNHRSEMEINKLRGALSESAHRIAKLEDICKHKDEALSRVIDERDDVAKQLKDFKSKKSNSSSLYIGDDLPIWEVLKPAKKSEILEVLRENMEESYRQKQYLDQLYALVLEEAPLLLEQMDQVFDEEDLSGDEEFC
uniref:Golgin subfamily B member 1-like n=1 Tax=Saccoglossus kowalevskii TaxID=10224 RepID=A0ABM0MD24_SACKO|nr:PREDICTED: golgin subfamily B member 1-like [Saccoglossus kowalevskii]